MAPIRLQHDFTDGGTNGFLATVQGFNCKVSFQSDAADLDGLKRLLGCLAIVYMPPEALDEALSDLEESWDFYGAQRALPARTPARTTAGTGKVVNQGTRPPLALSE
jgi:hypothetical protein